MVFGNIYSKKKILITGNTGFKGSWLTVWLLKLGAKVYGLANDTPTQPSMFKELGLRERIHHYEEDITDFDSVSNIIEKVKPDFVFHLAAQSLVSVSYSDPLYTIATNVIGTANILEALKKSNHQCIGVIITSDKCYDNVEQVWGYKENDVLGGKDIYSGSKGAAEIIFNSYFNSFFINKKSNIKVASARAGNVIGGGDWAKDRIVPDCMRAWSKNKIVEIRSPLSTRPWQHVLEPLSGYLNLGKNLFENNNLNGESFNFGPLSQFNNTVEDLLKDLAKFWKIKNFSKAFNIKDEIKFHEAGLLKLNCDKALSRLKWLPTLTYKELIEFTGTWYFNYYKSKENMLDFSIKQISNYEQTAFSKKLKWTK
tara:strand:- start:27779 stop:28882 length:1104 start_codon:yes stop_codon:yes gene_type:complete